MSAIEEVAPVLQLPRLATLAPTRRPVTRRTSAAIVSRQQWERRFRTRLRVSDTVIVLLACVLASAAVAAGELAAGAARPTRGCSCGYR